MKINIINTTTDSDITANHIAKCLIEKKLSPCVHIIPGVESTFKWQGNLEKSKEFLLIIKTIPVHLKECKKHILELHNYDTPEIIVTESEILLNKYSDWFLDNCEQ